METRRTTELCPHCSRVVDLSKRVVYHGPIEEMDGREFCCTDCLLDEYEKHRSKEDECPS